MCYAGLRQPSTRREIISELALFDFSGYPHVTYYKNHLTLETHNSQKNPSFRRNSRKRTLEYSKPINTAEMTYWLFKKMYANNAQLFNFYFSIRLIQIAWVYRTKCKGVVELGVFCHSFKSLNNAITFGHCFGL